MRLLETLIWAIVVLIVFGLIIWRADAFGKHYLASTAVAGEIYNNEAAAASLERLNAAKVAEATLPDRIAFEQANLRERAAEANAAAEAAERTVDDIVAARRAQATEIALRYVDAALVRSDLLADYGRYREICAKYGDDRVLEFDDFADSYQT